MIASDVMDLSASLLNDTAKDQWTYAIQLPYLQMAFEKLLSKSKNAGVPLLSEVSADTTVAIGATTLTTPTDITTVKRIFEKAVGATNDQFVKLQELQWEPTAVQTEYLRYWIWREGEVKFLGATTARAIRLEYMKTLTAPTTSSTVITLLDSKLYLAFMTASLCAGLGGGNLERAGILNSEAEGLADELLGIAAKSKQGLGYRRRPFRAR
jgi:hypothetical protein